MNLAGVSSKVSFAETLKSNQVALTRRELKTLQVNIGKLCNQACSHCHVEAGPAKTRENMNGETVDRLIELLKATPSINLVDITGGAPELNPNFRRFVKACTENNIEVIDRCNLTVLAEPGQEETHFFLAENKVKVVASLPCYSRDNVDKQRGKGVFGKSIDGLLKLNELGYGKEGSGLNLDLVYNPVGAFLPPPQPKLQADYKQQLRDDFGIEFNHLYCITNMPIKRFARDLERMGKIEEYMQLLLDNFNKTAAEEVMCRDLVSISWDGKIFDCDFNQMLEIDIGFKPRSIWDIESFSDLEKTNIAIDDHCYGCTAGAGSSCSGTLV